MKRLLLFILLICCSSVYSQMKLNMGETRSDHSYANIFSDGTSVILALTTGQKNMEIFTFDEDGKPIGKSEAEAVIPRAFLNKPKAWVYWGVGYKHMDIYVGEFNGKVTKTKIIHKKINVQNVTSVITADGKLELYLTDNSPSRRRYKKDCIDYLMVRYDPENKTFKVIDYTNIEGVEGSTSLIGLKGNDKYFVNWKKTSKGKYNFQILVVDEQKKIRTFAPVEFTFGERGLFIGGSAVGRMGANEEFKDFYYAIHTITRSKSNYNMNYKVYRVTESGECSSFSLKFPFTGAGFFFPFVFFPENTDGEHTFYLSDSGNKGLTFTNDFNSPVEPREIYMNRIFQVVHYQDELPDMYEAIKTHTFKSYSFNFCDDGDARMLIHSDNKQWLLYREKMP